ncbi:MAG: HEPN domain-containing protein [Promethearchaeota archaeon]
MGNKLEAKRWLDQARVDYKHAENNMDLEAYELVCFLSHQAAEKALKAVLYSLGFRPFGSSLKGIIDKIQQNQIQIQIPVNCAMELDKQYIPTRYPDAFISGIPHDYYSKSNAQDCLKWSRKILESVENYMKNI